MKFSKQTLINTLQVGYKSADDCVNALHWLYASNHAANFGGWRMCFENHRIDKAFFSSEHPSSASHGEIVYLNDLDFDGVKKGDAL